MEILEAWCWEISQTVVDVRCSYYLLWRKIITNKFFKILIHWGILYYLKNSITKLLSPPIWGTNLFWCILSSLKICAIVSRLGSFAYFFCLAIRVSCMLLFAEFSLHSNFRPTLNHRILRVELSAPFNALLCT